MISRLLRCIVLVLLLAPGVRAQGKFNKTVAVGQAGFAWTDLPGVDGKKHSLADLKDRELVVLCVTCNHCTIAIRYEDRIIEFAKKYADKKVALVAINVNLREADRLPKMAARATKKGFPFAYLFDESQKVGHAYGATMTPEFFVLNKERKIVYLGAMDDNNDPESVQKRYLEEAVEAALQGKAPPIAETKVRGCLVEYETK